MAHYILGGSKVNAGKLSVGTMASFIGYTFTLTFAVSNNICETFVVSYCFIAYLVMLNIYFRFKELLIPLVIYVAHWLL
jgi:hypothetical protein